MPELPLFANAALFTAAALIVLGAGVMLTRRADVLADRTGIGEAVVGAVLLGVATSLSGTVTSVTAAAGGDTALSISNALGGIAVQTAFLAVADLFYRKANLEHAAASAVNLMQATVLIVLLAIVLVAAMWPAISVGGLHPASFVLVVVYLGGMRLARQARERPMWLPKETGATRADVPSDADDAPATRIIVLQLCGLIVLVGAAGWVLAETGVALAAQTGWSQTVVGTLLTAVVTSFPELVTTVAAVRRGALQLAVGGIIGGNTYDVLFLAASDAAYRDGSIYHAMEARHLGLAGLGILMAGVLVLGLLRRQRHGAAGIGFESVLLLALYLASVAGQVWLG